MASGTKGIFTLGRSWGRGANINKVKNTDELFDDAEISQIGSCTGGGLKFYSFLKRFNFFFPAA